MITFLQDALIKSFNLKHENTDWRYEEDINDPKSFIHKVGVCCAIDTNKADWVFIAIGTQRSEGSLVDIHGMINFKGGENDDPGNVLRRVNKCLERADLLFEDIIS